MHYCDSSDDDDQREKPSDASVRRSARVRAACGVGQPGRLSGDDDASRHRKLLVAATCM
jgi:hypothetical protein